MPFPKFTIVTATYNSKKFLELNLKSVEEQTYRNIEHVFVDAFSDDGTVEIIQKYIKRNPDIETKFVQSEPKGISDALNVGLKHASGDVVHFLHSDDYYIDKNSLKKVAKRYQKNPDLQWLIGNPTFEVKGKYYQVFVTKMYKLMFKSMMHMRNLISHENTFATREFYTRYGPFDEKSKVSVEYGIWLKGLREVKPEFVHDYLTVFIVHGESTSSDPFNMLVRATREDFRIWKENKSLPILGFYDKRPVYRMARTSVETINELLDKYSPIRKLRNGKLK